MSAKHGRPCVLCGENAMYYGAYAVCQRCKDRAIEEALIRAETQQDKGYLRTPEGGVHIVTEEWEYTEEPED